MRFIFILSTAFLFLCACSQDNNSESITENYYHQNLLESVNYDIYQGKHDADKEILESAHAVTASLEKLARIEQALHPKLKLPQEKNPAQIGLSDLATIDWSGPIEPLLRQLAKTNHYKLRVLGKKPAIPVLISINKENISMATLLRDIEYQSQRKATIQLYHGSKTIELRYNKV